jgi:hypothetical protein
LGDKTILIDIEVIDTPIDYNILFRHSYMYAMNFVASSMFHMMIFPHNGKIVTIDHLTHYEPNNSANIDNILPLVFTSSYYFSVMDMVHGVFKDPSLLGAYHGAPPLLHPSISSQVCIVSSNGIYIGDNTPLTEAPPDIEIPPVEELLPQEFPEKPTAPLIQDSPPPSRGKSWFGRQFPKPLRKFPFFTPYLESKHSR